MQYTERQAVEIAVLALEKLGDGQFAVADVMARVAEMIGRETSREMIEDVVEALNRNRDLFDQLSARAA
jgi:hypothetical protein